MVFKRQPATTSPLPPTRPRTFALLCGGVIGPAALVNVAKARLPPPPPSVMFLLINCVKVDVFLW